MDDLQLFMGEVTTNSRHCAHFVGDRWVLPEPLSLSLSRAVMCQLEGKIGNTAPRWEKWVLVPVDHWRAMQKNSHGKCRCKMRGQANMIQVFKMCFCIVARTRHHSFVVLSPCRVFARNCLLASSVTAHVQANKKVNFRPSVPYRDSVVVSLDTQASVRALTHLTQDDTGSSKEHSLGQDELE